jgi:hypothetical protein
VPSQNFKKRLVASSCPSVWDNLAHSQRILMKFDISVFFENLWRRFHFHFNLTRITVTLHKDRYRFLIISRSVLRMKNVSDKICRESKHTHFIFKFFFRKNHAAYEVMWEKIVVPDRPQMTIWRMRIACWILNTTNTHSEYVTLIAFLLQQWLNEHPSM